MVPKAIRERVARQIAGEKHFFRVRMPPNGPRELSRAPREAVWALLGSSGGLLAHSWALLRDSWRALGPLFGALVRLLDPPEGVSEAS